MKRNILLILILSLLLTACSISDTDSDKVNIVTTIFPLYDFTCQVIGDTDDVNITMLLPPGGDSHTYSPSPKEILTIENCDLFIYIGGESDHWIDEILASLKNNIRTLKLTDHIDLLYESHDHDDHTHEEVDEHIWTSLRNAAQIVRLIADELTVIDVDVQADDYLRELDKLDVKFTELLSDNTKPFVFGDKFPFRYFARDYDIGYYAAYPSCNTESDPSAATIASLIDIVEDKRIDTVFHIEFSSTLIAETIADGAGNCDIALWHSCHNVSADDLKNGVTYLELMSRNYDVIENYILN